MTNTKLLSDLIKKNGYTESNFARLIGLTSDVFKARMNDGNFGVIQVSRIYDVLNLPPYNDVFVFD